MAKKDFDVEVKRDQNGFWTARAFDPETGQEVENFAGANRDFALLGLRQSLEARYAPPERVTMTIDLPGGTS